MSTRLCVRKATLAVFRIQQGVAWADRVKLRAEATPDADIWGYPEEYSVFVDGKWWDFQDDLDGALEWYGRKCRHAMAAWDANLANMVWGADYS